jgi:hypothetical protein
MNNSNCSKNDADRKKVTKVCQECNTQPMMMRIWKQISESPLRTQSISNSILKPSCFKMNAPMMMYAHAQTGKELGLRIHSTQRLFFLRSHETNRMLAFKMAINNCYTLALAT